MEGDFHQDMFHFVLLKQSNTQSENLNHEKNNRGPFKTIKIIKAIQLGD